MNPTEFAPDPLGVSLEPGGAKVGVYSGNGAAAYFCLYDEAGEREVSRTPLTPDGLGAHHGFVAGVSDGARYGFRVDGPFDPGAGHRFDVSKLLTDPYAAKLDRSFRLHPSMFERGVDSGPFAPKAVVIPNASGKPGEQRIAWKDTIIYELNLRGFTKLRADIPDAARGRFLGLAQPVMIAHLKSLGVTSVEIMPADAWIDERHLPPLGLSNAWGYNPVVLGVPDPRLAPDGWAEVRAATDALHEAGMEAILDIVLNHNGESDEFGPTISFRGLDNASYFRLIPDDRARYVNDMGCGNCLALDRPCNVDMAMAALRRWMIRGGIDGFRFDLAPAIGRREWGFDANAPLFQAIANDPVVSRAKLIAEPWDIGPGGYQVGHFPDGWGEWNDHFRDTARRFWRTDGGMLGGLAGAIAGSHDAFPNASSPSKSVNFVVAHDGFTLADLVSYSHKHNEANGEHNNDGTNENYSWNHGVEGPSDDPNINAARGRDMRNLLATLMVARGTPMLAMGSEMGHIQSGNNNAYAQDNAISWLDWSKADAALASFVGRLAAIRRAHPALSRAVWLTGQPFDESGLPDVEWRDAAGPLTSGEQWQAPFGDCLAAVLAAPSERGIDRVVVAFNRAWAPTSLRLPEAREGHAWRVLLDCCDDAITDRGTELADRTPLAARGTLILAEFEAPPEGPRARAPDERDIDALAVEAGVSTQWWDIEGKLTIVSAATKLAVLDALRLPARTRAQARGSLEYLLEETRARLLPSALTLAADGAMRAPYRSDASAPRTPIEFTLLSEDGDTLSGRVEGGAVTRRVLASGREIDERLFDLPSLPIGRHRLEVGGVSCALTVAPREAYRHEACGRPRFGVSAQLYALRRGGGDQGIGDFTALGLAGESAGRAGAAYLGISPMHALFASDRGRASPYHPSDRRFLDPLLIDVLASEGLPEDETLRAALAAQADAIAAAAARTSVDYEGVWAIKSAALRARFAAFERARAARPTDPIFSEYAVFVAEGSLGLRRFAVFDAISRERGGEDWRRWPEELRRSDPASLVAASEGRFAEISFSLFCQWLADRQLAGAAARAKSSGLEMGFYRDFAVGAAPDGAETWSRADELAIGVSVGAPPDPFSAHGQIWHLPPPNPVAGAREGWRGLSALFSANMRHAGLLRIDHAMGLTRLFVIPDGAKPAEGAYLAYPVDDLVGQIALESQRHRCMVVGEDLGTVPEGFRDKLTRANVAGMRVLWFERDGLGFLDPRAYPWLSVACASTHDLPTLAGWWQGADIAERLKLGLMSFAEAQSAEADRQREKFALLDALRQAGHFSEIPPLGDPMSDALAAAIHAFIGASGSFLASAQFDDLTGETVATNLPGTDRERPNWRHRSGLDAGAMLHAPRARAILEAIGQGRR